MWLVMLIRLFAMACGWHQAERQRWSEREIYIVSVGYNRGDISGRGRG
jgi:hypothetical protein